MEGQQGKTGATGPKGAPGRIHIPAVIGYVILTIGMSLGLFFQQKNFEKELKFTLRTEAVEHCINSISSVEKYNDLVYSLIETRQQARTVAKNNNEKNLIKVNNDAIIRYNNLLIPQKTVEECEETAIP